MITAFIQQHVCKFWTAFKDLRIALNIRFELAHARPRTIAKRDYSVNNINVTAHHHDVQQCQVTPRVAEQKQAEAYSQ